VTPEERAARADRVRHLFDNDDVRQIFEELREAYVKAWLSSTTTEAREDAHRYVKLLEKLQADIRAIALDGGLARQRMAELEGEQKRRWFGR
jgi:hypothetical protein